MKRDYTIAMLLKLKALGSMKTKLTATIVEALGATGIEYAIGDVEHKGLTLRVSGTGVKSFALAYRSKVRKKVVYLPLGRFPAVTLAGARVRWTEARKVIDEGRDPVPFR